MIALTPLLLLQAVRTRPDAAWSGRRSRRRSTWLTLLAAPALIGAADGSAVRYDCVLDRRVVLTSDGAEWSQSSQAIPASESAQWSFSVETDRAGKKALVRYEPDMMQLSGSHDLVWLAPGQFAFSPAFAGPCMFTEKACVALVEVSDVDEGKALVSVTPAGSALDQQSGKRHVFQMISLGSCVRKKVSK
jgi:hypothetical protein